MKALLVLEDGRIFTGSGFGAKEAGGQGAARLPQGDKN